MALIKCPDCKKKISDSVDTCPNCGKNLTVDDKAKGFALLKKDTKCKKSWVICVLFLVLLTILCFLDIKFRRSEENKKQWEEKEFYENLDMFLSLCNVYIADLGVKVRELDDVWSNLILKESNDETDKYTKDKNGKFVDFSTAIGKYISNNEEGLEKIKESFDKCEEYFQRIEFCGHYDEFTNTIIGFSEELKEELWAYYNVFYKINFNYNDFARKVFEHKENTKHWINAIKELIKIHQRNETNVKWNFTMDRMINDLVNTSPIIVLLLLLGLDVSIIRYKKKLFILTYILIFVICGVFPKVVRYGNGNLFNSILTLLICLLFLVFLLPSLMEKKKIFSTVFFLIMYGGVIVHILYSFYYRLKIEKIVKIKAIDEFVYELKKVDYAAMFLKVINNDWVMGISVTIIGGYCLKLIDQKIDIKGSELKDKKDA